jgi:hypothetical protein
MHDHSSTYTALAQEGRRISNLNFTGVVFTAHVRQRLTERGSDQQTITARIQQTRQKHQQLRGHCALIGSSPVIIAKLRASRSIVQSVLVVCLVSFFNIVVAH